MEPDDVFEGVGAHPLNPRYDPVDETDPEPRLDPAPFSHPALFAALEAAGTAPPDFEGHDGSHYQWDQGVRAGASPPVDLVTLAQASRIVWWKCTQSTRYVDPSFATIWREAEALFEYRMAYHWLSSTTDPVAQAEHLCAIIDSLGGLGPGDGVMIDAEEAGVTRAKAALFGSTVMEHFRRPCISTYSGLYVAGGEIWDSDELREMGPMHLAAYVTRARLNLLMAQRGAKPYHAWQYSSNGPVPGVVGRADMNTDVQFYMYDLICAKQPKPPIEPEKPPPEPQPQPGPAPVIPGGEMSALVTPVRFYDSRSPGSPYGGQKHGTGDTLHVPLPPHPEGVGAAIVNITVVEPGVTGYVVMWGDGGRPATSNVQMNGENDANLAVVPLTAEGGVNVWTSAPTHILLDLQGWA